MVGLKTFWILISALFLLAACVPQTKQTECGSNEAFNASLRTCVPIVGGPTSFINVATYTPQFTQTRSKDDTTALTFTITVSNPYNQSYSVSWERVFNASPVAITGCGNTLSCAGALSGSYLGTVLGQVGTHIITAKIKDANNVVVDTQNFELKINDLPRPIINTATITPAAYAFDVYPTDAPVQFYFTIKHNNATFDATNGYKTTWSIQKNGSALPAFDDTDLFTTFAPTGTTTTAFGDAPAISFDPAHPSLGVGSYIIRAVVSNSTPGEVVDERQWNVNVKNPDLANVTNVSAPAPGVTILAHNNVDYNDYPTESWIYSGTRPNFCITVDDRDGTYAADGDSLLVKFYLDGMGGDICTKKTLDTPGTQTVCLLDADPCQGSVIASNADASLQNVMKFSNTSSSVAQNHTIVARIFDENTTYELQPSDVLSPAGLYPIVWTVLNNPVNVAPVMSFGPVSNMTGCISSGAYSRSNCAVNQGNNLVSVSVTVTDDFYSPSAEEEEFLWDFKLKMNGADISTPPKTTSCTKALGAVVPAYTTNWSCVLEVPHYISTGALNPAGPFQIVATMQDSGSPVGGLPMASQSLTWNLTVTETNSILDGSSKNILISPQQFLSTTSHVMRDSDSQVSDPAGSNFVTELETITFRPFIRDPELDDFNYKIYKCGTGSTAATCANPSIVPIVSTNYLRVLFPAATLPFTDTTLTDPVLVNATSYTIPETALLDVGQDVDKSTSTPIYFRVDVTDIPHTAALAPRTDSSIFTVYVRNHNPAPVIDTTGALPVPNTAGTAVPVSSGMPYSINPGSVDDASNATSEETILYKWYVRTSLPAVGAWTEITGATTKNLTWTPGNNLAAGTVLELKLCVGDRPAANPVVAPGAVGANCTTPSWFVEPKSNIAKPDPSVMSVGGSVAVWNDPFDGDATQDVIYSAYVGLTDLKIYVNKTVRDTTSGLNVSFEQVSFDAVDGATPAVVTGISLAGTADSLYIAYGASVTPTTNSVLPRIRRIGKAHGAATEGEKTGLVHKGKFGFAYSDFTFDVSGCTNCAQAAGTNAGPATITINAPGINGPIVVNGVTFTAVAAPSTATEVCSSATCSANDGADSLASKINASTDPLLQGISALASGNVVNLYGPNQYDSIVINQVVGNSGIGSIFVSGGSWYLPFINASLAGADQNNITLARGAVDLRLQNGGVGVTTQTLTSIGQVLAFDSKLNASDDLVIASISGNIATAGRAKISRFMNNAGTYQAFPGPAISTLNIFGTKLFEEISLAADTTGNTSIYVLGKERVADGGKYDVGRYPATMTGTTAEAYLEDQTSTTDDTEDFITNTLMTNPTLVAVPNTSDARIFFNSVGTPAAANATRVARWKSDNTVTCDICSPIGLTGTNTKIAVSNVTINATVGTAGLGTENVKDIAYIFSSYLNAGVQEPTLGLINLESETIQSSTVDAAGLFRPPYAK